MFGCEMFGEIFLRSITPRNLGILNSCFLTSPTSMWDLCQFLVIKIYKNFGQKGGPVGCKVNSQHHHFLGERLGLLTGSFKILRVCVSHRVLGWWRMMAAEPNQTPYGLNPPGRDPMRISSPPAQSPAHPAGGSSLGHHRGSVAHKSMGFSWQMGVSPIVVIPFSFRGPMFYWTMIMGESG